MDVIVNHSLPTLALAFEPQLGDVSVIVHYPLPLCPQVKIASLPTSNVLEVKEGKNFVNLTIECPLKLLAVP